MTFKLGSFCFHLLNAYIMGVCHHTWFVQHRGFNPGICACWTSTLPAKLHPQYLKLFLKSFILNLDFNVCFNSLKSVHSWITKYMSGIYVFLYKTLFWKCKKKKRKYLIKTKEWERAAEIAEQVKVLATKLDYLLEISPHSTCMVER